jgi:hypothetical protein
MALARRELSLGGRRLRRSGGRLARELHDEERAQTGDVDPRNQTGEVRLLLERLENVGRQRFEHLLAAVRVHRHAGDDHLLEEADAVVRVGTALFEQFEHERQTLFDRVQRIADELAALGVLHAAMRDGQRAVGAGDELVLRREVGGQRCRRDERVELGHVQGQAGVEDLLVDGVGFFLVDALLRDLLLEELLALFAGEDTLLLGALDEEETVLGGQSGKEMALRAGRKRNRHVKLQSLHLHRCGAPLSAQLI